MTEYDAIVYDLDGTLVHLAVDWGAVASDVLAVYERASIEPPSDSLWELLERAEEYELKSPVESTIAGHEHDGARASRRLPHADELVDQPESMPIGVCSLNCERACHLALETHDLFEPVDAVVGRDTVATSKPHPEPLLETISGLGVRPERTLFVGDSPRDETTAKRAGTGFEYVDGQRTLELGR
ncbi:HAD family hydrolase [Halobacteria archaeon AArc-curdl1]|uniref:HAD family hydrolase n=1 Tax=Natronosalvus hydrolyticus TaxID=2979988 RepID=A0AAP2Z7I4_9EURY|nr:HAD family hydrolase [Halobacteria archaeon AArc-curdl1]